MNARGGRRLILLLVAAAACRVAAADALPAASSDDHAWFIVEVGRPDPRIELRHHAREMDGPYFSRGLPLARPPEAMAAWGETLWLLYPPQRRDGTLVREAFAVQVEQNPALGGWFQKPHDRLRAVASLEGPGRLAAFAAAAGGPVALLLPAGGGPANATTSAGPRLVQLRGRQWTELGLPDGFPSEGRLLRLGVAGTGGRGLVVLSDGGPGGPLGRGRAAAWWRDRDGRWSRTDVPVNMTALRQVTRAEGNVALVSAASEPDRIRIDYLRPTRLLELAELPAPGGRWAVAGLRDRLIVMEQDALGDLAMRTIDPVTGDVGPRRDVVPQPLMTARVLHRPLLFALAVTALMVVLMFQPNARSAAVTLPPQATVCSAMTRLVAVAIDLAAGAVVTLLVMRCGLSDLARMPLLTADPADSIPFLVMACVTTGHSLLGELLWQRSLGKAVVGARVVSINGTRPSPVAVLVRNAFKLLVLLIPILAVFALLNPNVQGLGDLVARTVVVRRADAPVKDR